MPNGAGKVAGRGQGIVDGNQVVTLQDELFQQIVCIVIDGQGVADCLIASEKSSTVEVDDSGGLLIGTGCVADIEKALGK